MGISPLRNFLSGGTSPLLDGNPDPKRFKILSIWEVKEYTLAVVRYPNCTTYKGHKLLMYEGRIRETLSKLEELDPHVLEEGLSPIARFAPTDAGFRVALQACEGKVVDL